MTEKLYDKDSYLKEFSADVTDCFEKDGKFFTVLDKTAFFPEGGGQYGDTGFLNNTRVKDTVISGNKICHIAENPFKIGDRVHGKIDWEKRFFNMQNHSGEHIVSGIVNSLFGLQNVGFHLGHNFVTVDYDGVLTAEQLHEIEVAANSAVFENLPITAEYPSKEELKKIPYRSKKEIDGDIRIVTIKGVDICACCAPHLKCTAEVGIIKMLDMKRYKGGVRINMLCGGRALDDYDMRYKSTAEISNLLSCRQNECAGGVQNLLNEIENLKAQNNRLSKQLVDSAVENLFVGQEFYVEFCNFSGDNLRDFAEKGFKKTHAPFLALNGDDENGYNYVFMCGGERFSDTVKNINRTFSGKGGGRPPMACGVLKAKSSEISEKAKDLFD